MSYDPCQPPSVPVSASAGITILAGTSLDRDEVAKFLAGKAPMLFAVGLSYLYPLVQLYKYAAALATR